MKGLKVFVLVLLATAIGAPVSAKQDYASPLVITGTTREDGPETVYSIVFKNISNQTVTDICIDEAGAYFHSRSFHPGFRLPAIKPGKTHTFNVWVRGKVSPPVHVEDIGVVGQYRQGNKRVYVRFPDPPCRHRYN